MQWYLAPLISGNVAFALLDAGVAVGSELAIGNAVAAMASGFAAGGVGGGNLRSAVIGAFTAGAQFGIGELFGHATPKFYNNFGVAVQKAIAHAAVGCAGAAAAGGSCKAGAMAAGFSSIAGPLLPGGGSQSFHAGNFVGRMIVGAIGSKLGGGKYENGAMTAAMEYLFNALGGRLKVVGGTPAQQQRVRWAVDAIDNTAVGKSLDAAIPSGDITVSIETSPNGINGSATLAAPFVTRIDTAFVTGNVCCYGTASGRADFTLERLLAHEFGHHTGLADEGTPNSMGNVNKWENPIMRELSPYQPDRTMYYFPPGMKGLSPASKSAHWRS
jgi:hypothetical protein